MFFGTLRNGEGRIEKKIVEKSSFCYNQTIWISEIGQYICQKKKSV